MKNNIFYQDIEMICSMMVPGNYKVEINTEEQKTISLADNYYNTNNSNILVTDHFLENVNNNYDMILDFSHEIKHLENYFKTEFIIKYNPDGSIQYLFEQYKNEKFVSMTFFRNKEKTISVFHKNNLFFKKQLENLPCDNYWVCFGDSFNQRKIDVALYNKNFHLLNLQIAFNENSSSFLSKQKYFMSKLSFYDFESVELPNEYFYKNDKLLVNSLIVSKIKPNQVKKIFPLYFEEIFRKTTKKQNIINSTFYSNLINKIKDLNSTKKSNLLLNFLNKIILTDQIYFGLSLGKLTETKGTKLVCTDFSEACINSPILFDFFHQIFDEFMQISFENKKDIKTFLNKKINQYGIKNMLDSNMVNPENYLVLFLICQALNNTSKEFMNIINEYTNKF